MKAVVIGYGKIGKAIIYDLLKHNEFEKIYLIDQKLINIIDLDGRVDPYQYDLNNEAHFKTLEYFLESKKINVIISASDYSLNLKLTELAIKIGANFCDLGGNNDVVNAQFALNDKAIEKGITVIPAVGLAPGLAEYVAAWGVNRFLNVENVTTIDSVKIRVGGLPIYNLKAPLNYKLVFSSKGLINEYIEPCTIVRDHEIKIVEPLTDIEELNFFWKLEAFNTSGGISGLANSLKHIVKDLDYKTIRYPGHCNIFAGMRQLGLLNDPQSREMIEKAIDKTLSNDDGDCVLMRVIVSSNKDNEKTTYLYDLADYHSPETGHSAMARTTAFPTSIVAHMLARGECKPGVYSGENCLNLDKLMEELGKRGLNITENRL